MFFYYTGESAASDPRNLPLSSIVPSCVFDLDATLTASYDGTGQLWKNLVPAPADGSAQTAYDFNRGSGSGVSTDDPTFVGTANDPAAYWSFDGGDWFTKETANTAFLENLHRTDVTQPFTIGAAFRIPAGGYVNIFSTAHGINYAPTSRGITTISAASDNHYFALTGDTATVRQDVAGALGNTIYLVVFSYNPATNTLRRWINTSTKTTLSLTKNTSVTNPSNKAAIGAYADGASRTSNLGRIYSVFGCNAFIDDADVALIKAQLELRHGRTY